MLGFKRFRSAASTIAGIELMHRILHKYRKESTVRYLGVEVDDALEMAEQTEV